METGKWSKADENGNINVPDYLDRLVNYVGTQMRFHTISDKNEIQTVCDIVCKAEQFFTDHFKEKWISVETPPTHENWVRVLIDGKHNIMPHCLAGDYWFEYGSPTPTTGITHWQEFTDLTPPTK